MEIRNIILELGIDKDGNSLFCKEARNNTVEIESSWSTYRALDYADSYVNEHSDATVVLHIAYDDEKDMIRHMKVTKKDCEFITVYDSKSAEKELYKLCNNISIKFNEFFKASMKRGKELIKEDIKDIKSDIKALQEKIDNLTDIMVELSEAL